METQHCLASELARPQFLLAGRGALMVPRMARPDNSLDGDLAHLDDTQDLADPYIRHLSSSASGFSVLYSLTYQLFCCAVRQEWCLRRLAVARVIL